MKALFLSIPIIGSNTQTIKTIVNETDADIVIARKWIINDPDFRFFTVEDLEKKGFNRDKIFFTPSNKPHCGVEEFLREHDNIETFVILNFNSKMYGDDNDIVELGEKYPENYIDVKFFLWPVDAMKVISILNGVKQK